MGGAAGVGEVGVAGGDGDDLVAVAAADRDGLVAGGDVAAPDRVALAEDPALGERDVQVPGVLALQDAADLVLLVGRGAGGGPDLGEADEPARAVLDRAPQEEVREGEVGEQLPFGHEPLEVGGGVRGQVGVGADDIAEC